MNFIRGMVVAFSMYSRIPMPKVEWTGDALRYALWMLPLVGLLEGVFLSLWWWFSSICALPDSLVWIGFVLLPVLYTGGIHLDGFCDTVDALASHADREKKLEILKDPHIGAFAAIGLVCYLLFQGALWATINPSFELMCSVTAGIVLTRVIGAGSLIFLPKAKKEGLGQTFAGSASKKGAGLWFGALLVVSLGAIFACSFWGGILITCGTIGIVVFYRRMAITQFGGVTGDLSGWLVQTGEVGMLFLLMLGEHIGGVIG